MVNFAGNANVAPTTEAVKGPPDICKGGHPLHSHPLCGFAKDGFPCACIVVLALVDALFGFPLHFSYLRV